jgi:tRNA pseudouridine-54 N-methylase
LRHIILLAPSGEVSSDGAGRISRFVVGALLLSHGARRDVRLDLVFDGEKQISFDGAGMRNVRPDEQSLSGILRAGLRRLGEGKGQRIMQGINAKISPLGELLGEAKGAKLYFSGRGGKAPVPGGRFSAFFQYPNLEENVEDDLRRRGYEPVNIGRCPMYVDQAVVVLNRAADRLVGNGS